jgi:tRNA pseudouridine38-40 synthase
MRNFRLLIAYDGTDFHGWQRQDGLRTVQGELEPALQQITGRPCPCNASGRTDAGVHALGQVVNFHAETRLDPPTLLKALNALTPRDLLVRDIGVVPDTFHATLSALTKRYRYVIDNGRIGPDPLRLRQTWHVHVRLDEAAMNEAGRALLGTHDFRSFETEYPNRATSVRTILDLAVSRTGDQVTIEVEADGFLYNMVRAIAGSLMLVGAGKRPVGWLGEARAALSREAAGPTAPPQGLYLLHVTYPDDRHSP